jgi:cell division protein FtsW
MARTRVLRRLQDPAPSSGLRQLTFSGLAGRLAERDAASSARGVFHCAVLLLALGLVLQAGHAATTLRPEDFRADLLRECLDRGLALVVLLVAARYGIPRLRRHLPWLIVLAGLALVAVLVPGLNRSVNGSARWLDLGFSFQPSELARLVLIVWVADRCSRMAPDLPRYKSHVARALGLVLLFALLVWIEPDKGGALVLFSCACMTMWIAGVGMSRVALPFLGVVALGLALAATSDSYARGRLDMWVGKLQNEQVQQSMWALASAGWSGAGFAQGELRNRGFQYMDSDFVFALVNEEFGWFGAALVIALFAALFWYSLRMVLAMRDRFDASAAFGLCIAVAVQALVHMGSVSGLLPPKGMTLPFLSDGGTSLVVTSLGLGLALGAARRSSTECAPCNPSNATV